MMQIARRRGGTARPDDAGSPIALSELPAPATRLRFTSSDSARRRLSARANCPTSSDSARVARPDDAGSPPPRRNCPPDDAGSPIALSELPAPATRLRFTSSDSARRRLSARANCPTSSDSARVARPDDAGSPPPRRNCPPDDAGSPIALSELPAPATRLRFTSSDSARQLPA